MEDKTSSEHDSIVSYSFRIATRLLSESTRATLVDSPTRCFWDSSIAKTIGTDIFTTDPSSSRRELKWSVWRNSFSFMNPRRGLAHPSLSTWTHWRSIWESLILGSDRASLVFTPFRDSSTKSSTSFPPSGSINPHETRSFWRDLALKPPGSEILTTGAKWVLAVFGRE